MYSSCVWRGRQRVICSLPQRTAYSPVGRVSSMYARTTPNSAYLSSTFEELVMRKCSCSLEARVSSAASQGRGKLELVDQVLSACLHSLGLDALDHLERNLSGEEGITSRTADSEYVSFRV